MSTIRDLFTTYAPESIERSPHLPASPHKAMDALCRCRTGAYGSSLSAGARCGPHHHIAHAWGHRHCPPCQQQQAAQGLHHQLDPQLPGVSFLLTCTVPEALRPLCRSQPRLAYQSLGSASSQARKRLAQDPRCLGTTLPGFPGILPPWGRQLPEHPHIHSIVPGGGLSQDRAAWWPFRTTFSVPVRALSPLSRALFTQEMRTAGQLAQSDPHVWTTPWNVHSQANP
jgi:Transposase zinc-binding domain/Putative transposase